MRLFNVMHISQQHTHRHGIFVVVSLHQFLVESLQVIRSAAADGIVEVHPAVMMVSFCRFQHRHRRMRPLRIAHVHQQTPRSVAQILEQHLRILIGIQHMTRRTVRIEVSLRLLLTVDGFRHPEAIVVRTYQDIVLLQQIQILLNRVFETAGLIGRRCLVPSQRRIMVQQYDARCRLFPFIDVLWQEDGAAHCDTIPRMQGVHRTVIERKTRQTSP